MTVDQYKRFQNLNAEEIAIATFGALTSYSIKFAKGIVNESKAIKERELSANRSRNYPETSIAMQRKIALAEDHHQGFYDETAGTL